MQEHIKIYRVKSPLFKGSVFLRYEKDVLTGFEVVLIEPLTHEQWKWLGSHIPLYRQNINELLSGGMTVGEIKAKSIQDKVIMFCHYYKAYRGVSYSAKMLEKANLKGVPVDAGLLETFFTSPLQNFTLKNYIDRINITKDWTKNGMEGNEFPAYWDTKLAKSLPPDKYVKYEQHMKKIGFVKKTTVHGTQWEKQNLFNK